MIHFFVLFCRDHVKWTEEDKKNARQKAQENSCVQIPLNEQGKNLLLQNILQARFYLG